MEKESVSYDLSIVVCCYRGANTIVECIASLEYLTLNNISVEVLFVDDGSEDGTDIIIKDHINNRSKNSSLVFNYFRKINEGLSIARNFGVQRSNSSLIAFVDEDAYVDPLFAKVTVDFFNTRKDINCTGGKVLLKNDESEFAKLIQYSVFESYINDSIGIIGTNMAFRKAFLFEVGGFQPEFTYRGDETALFGKAGEKLNVERCDNMVVKHHQPDTLKKWLQTRYENGYFGAAIFDLLYPNKYNYRNLVLSILTFLLPLTVLITIILLMKLFIILLIIYVLYFLKRFVFNKALRINIQNYNSYFNSENRVYSSLYVIYITILGFHYRDFGYLRGTINYKNYQWNRNNSIK